MTLANLAITGGGATGYMRRTLPTRIGSRILNSDIYGNNSYGMYLESSNDNAV